MKKLIFTTLFLLSWNYLVANAEQIIQNKNTGKYGIQEGTNTIIPQVYDSIEEAGGFYYILKKKGKYGFADDNGVILEAEYDKLTPNDTFTIIKAEKNGKVGYFTDDGMWIYKCIYDEIIDIGKRDSIFFN